MSLLFMEWDLKSIFSTFYRFTMIPTLTSRTCLLTFWEIIIMTSEPTNATSKERYDIISIKSEASIKPASTQQYHMLVTVY